MKNNIHPRSESGSQMKRSWKPAGAAALVFAGTVLTFLPTSNAELVTHGISAAQLNEVQGTTHDSVTVTAGYSINDFRVRIGSNGGDYNVQIGEDPLDDAPNGILMSSVAENGRDNYLTGTKTNCVSMVDFNANGYFISISAAMGFGAGANPEYNINVAGAYFPYNLYLGGFAKNSTGANGGPLDLLIASPGIALGTNFVDLGAGKSIVNLTNFGIDSRVDGVLLVSGAKNESANFGLVQVNVTNGTWNLFIKDDGQATTTSFEQDPIAFVFIPKTNTSLISGRFLGDGSIQMFSGTSPQFTVSSNSVGTYELKIAGKSPTNGVLIISAEGGRTINQHNAVSYQVNAAVDGWIIQSRDLPGTTALPAPLESPGPTEGVVSFVYIPGPTPGFTVIPTNNLITTESGGTATFSVALDTLPASDVTVAVSSSNPAEGTVSPVSLVFTPADWNVPQIVTITGQDDAVVDGTVAYSIVLAPATSSDVNYDGLNPADVQVVNGDNEGGITVAPTSGLTTTEAGGSATFTIRLNTQPTADVTIGLSSGNTSEGTVSPANLTFTTSDWNQEKVVTVTGVEDFIDDGNVSFTIITATAVSSDASYNGLNPADVSLVNLDDDTVGLDVSASGPNGLSVVEGKTNTYNVKLESQPKGNVTVTISSSDTIQGGNVSPAILSFTPGNWNIAQVVTVTAIDDLAIDGSTTYTISNAVSSSDPAYAALAGVPVLTTTLDNEGILSIPSGEKVYGTGLAGVGIAGRGTISDPNSPNYAGGNMTISITNNGTADDRLEIRSTGTGPGQISVSGNAVSYGGVAIATFAGGNGTTPLVISFNSSATPTAAEALLRSITFRNISGSPSLDLRSVFVKLTDGDGGITSAGTTVKVGLLRAVDFQEGADNGYGRYSGEVDIEVRQAAPIASFPAGGASGLFIDFPDAQNALQVLMRYDNIFGEEPGKIPTNAIIVSADLFLDVNDSGDGSPLYRMLRSFDGTNDTWESLGNGVDIDDMEARSAFDSAFGLENGDANTTIGTVTFSVLPDIQAWQGGVENYGWVMPGWVGRTDGTGFSPSEAPNIDDRPRLRVLWLPAGTASASFRQGVSEYTNAVDTRIRANTPDTESSTSTGVFVDWAVTGATPENDEQVLIRFDNIFGNGVGQIPAGSTIHAAILDLSSTLGQAMGDGGTFHPMLQPWADTDTWNTLVNGVTADDVEAAAASTAVAGSSALDPNVQAGFLEYELTRDVQAWASGARPNYGWVILPWPNGSDGWGFATAEAVTERDRPRLRVYFTPGAPATRIQSITRTFTTVTIQFTGVAGETYNIVRSGTVDGTYSRVGSAVAGGDGTATFTDNPPLPDAGFYRISHP
ncbi:MAG: DNRLRE domain-containing protein [Verrucomicrobiota bacterium]